MEPAKTKEDGGADRGGEPSSSALLSAGKVEFTLKQEIQDEEEEEDEDEDEGRPDGDDMDDDEEETEDDGPTPTTTPLPTQAAPPPEPSEPSAGKPSLKRPRASSHEYTPCVQVIYKCLTNESANKLKELMQQWVDWHSKSVAILEDANQTSLQSGDETYYPTLQVGEHKSSAVRSGNCTPECTQSSLSREKEASFLGRVGSDQAEIPKEWPRDNGAVNNTRQLLLDKRGPAGGPRATSRYHQSATGGKSDDSKTGFVGNETRHSLGILDKDPPPWLHGVRELGYSPGYLANMGISLCGFAMNSSLSWDLNANWNQDMEKSTVPPASKGLSTFLDPRAQAVMPSPRGLTTPIRMPPSSRMPLNCLAGSSPPSRVSASENLLKRKGITARTSVQGQPSIDNNSNNTPGKGTDLDLPHAPPASQGAHSEAGGEMGDDVARSGGDQQEGNKNASFDNWDPLETTVLVAAKLRLEELIESKKLPNDVKSKNQRWDYISEVCAKSEVRRTGTQCMNRWNRVLKEWKAIYNYEQNIPPGQHSYWSMMIRERKSAKLPGTFDSDLYKAIESRYGRSRGNLRGNMLMDSAGDMLGSDATDSVHAREEHMELDVDGIARAHAFENASSDEADLVTNVTCRPDYYRNAKESSNGYKRFKLEGAPLVKEDLEESFRKLVDIFQKVEEERNEWQRELADIRRSEFEANVQLQKEKLENERQNNMALFQIANAIHFLSNNFGNNSSNNTVQQ